MSTLTQLWLILHVILGLAGTLWFGAIWFGLNRKEIALDRVRHYAFFGALAMVFSWISGGFYYTSYYGRLVRPAILAGKYPWAHEFFTDTKEHLFLFIPFIAVAVALMFWTLGERLWKQPSLRTMTIRLTGLVVALGSLMALMGVVISGAVR